MMKMLMINKNVLFVYPDGRYCTRFPTYHLQFCHSELHYICIGLVAQRSSMASLLRLSRPVKSLKLPISTVCLKPRQLESPHCFIAPGPVIKLVIW